MAKPPPPAPVYSYELDCEYLYNPEGPYHYGFTLKHTGPRFPVTGDRFILESADQKTAIHLVVKSVDYDPRGWITLMVGTSKPVSANTIYAALEAAPHIDFHSV